MPSLSYDEVMEAVRLEEEARGEKVIPVRAWPNWGGARKMEAEFMVGTPAILALMRRAEWIKPVAMSNRMTLFDREALQKAWGRFCLFGLDVLKAEAKEKSPNRRSSRRRRKVRAKPSAPDTRAEVE